MFDDISWMKTKSISPRPTTAPKKIPVEEFIQSIEPPIRKADDIRIHTPSLKQCEASEIKHHDWNIRQSTASIMTLRYTF